MKNKKTKVLIILISLVIIFVFVSILISDTSPKYEAKITKLCNNINNDIKNKENIVILYKANEITDESSDTISQLEENYSKNINMYIVNPIEFKQSCIKEKIETNLYNNIVNVGDSTAIIYKDGKYAAMISGLDNYESIENYFIELEIIKKEEIKEEITLEKYKEKVKYDKYLLLIINNETDRKNLEKLIINHFPNYKYDIINMKSDIGSNIKEYINKNYKKINEFPNLIYFEKGKMIYSEAVIDDKTIDMYKHDLNELLGNKKS